MEPLNIEPTQGDMLALAQLAIREPLWWERLKVIVLSRMVREKGAANGVVNTEDLPEEVQKVLE